MTALEAIKARNVAGLMDAFSNVEEANLFREQILPQLSPGDCKFFWKTVMEPDQLEQTINAVRDVCLRIATRNGLLLGRDFNAATDAQGDSVLVIDTSHHSLFYDAIPAARHSVLRFYLQTK